MIPCPICGSPFPLLRKTKFGYNFCVNCSTIGAKKGIPVQRGTGEDTWDEIIIVNETDYKKLNTQYELTKLDDCFEEIEEYASTESD